jgi:endonuclease YncB( thermonuclease family)
MTRRTTFTTIVFTAAMFACSVAAAELIGRAQIIDGDTIDLARQRVRLWGIDAPESGQTCMDGEQRRYLCGSKAAFALADFIGEATVRCEPVDRDQYHRTVARCSARDEDLGSYLVRNGWALDWPHFSKAYYVKDQKEAREAKRGMWIGQFVEPWRWVFSLVGSSRHGYTDKGKDRKMD